jgi:7-keto-8-aminopelargonate synthetase-like enzyme
MPLALDDETLRAYLSETLPPADMARVEKALRESAELRQLLEEVRNNRHEANWHGLGAIWKRDRLSCATRQQIGSYLLEALDEGMAEYIKFHIEVVCCPYCRANVEDLRGQIEQANMHARARQKRFYQSSRGLLPTD